MIEGDEYDSAFFDKRSKFIHYAPHIAVLNNLEFDHIDIFRDLPPESAISSSGVPSRSPQSSSALNARFLDVCDGGLPAADALEEILSVIAASDELKNALFA